MHKKRMIRVNASRNEANASENSALYRKLNWVRNGRLGDFLLNAVDRSEETESCVKSDTIIQPSSLRVVSILEDDLSLSAYEK